MAPMTVSAINAALAVSATARPVIEAAQSALAAVQTAGIPLGSVELTYLQNMPADVWNDLKGAILGAYDDGKTPELQPLQDAPAYGLANPTSDNGKVLLRLSGPIPKG